MTATTERNERVLAVIREIHKIGLTRTTSYEKPIYQIGVVAFAEKVVDLLPDRDPKMLVRLITKQALTDFIVAQEPYQEALR